MTSAPVHPSGSAVPRHCVVLAAGEYYGEAIATGDAVAADGSVLADESFVVAADGGLDHARDAGIVPDFVVGDFDSVSDVASSPVAADDAHTIVLPREKDDPDLLSALKLGWREGARVFDVYGALGGRIDHTISALQCAALVSLHGGLVFLHGDGTVVVAITDAALDFPAHEPAGNRMVSVFAHSDEARGVSEPGMKYELAGATMTNSEVNGVSNEFLPHVPATIDVADGTLLVSYPVGTPRPDWRRHREPGGTIGDVCTEVSAALSSRATTGERTSARERERNDAR
ncbi:thiamine diphosphokinase [Bifidobacterium choloepi]|uniref:Thiamine diphosphokinase n=1 Tax=Bifidobacterium choloepi TaxID=2614131 RepID=A0A6I5NI96_9BIFI|nr:thiamine diphosphokinase [Bifidobacterium choloepi]NEG70083.1 thiamine diphosphokinase [Bifidobacterium choloepi]